MKKILITGANSYIGTSFEKWMSQYDGYEIDTIDMIDPSWREHDFSKYDVVFHVAGIAHADIKALSESDKENYYKINRDLTVETAKKAKESGVKQFIFMSSIIVFGSNNIKITKNTVPAPDNFYGDSKLQADNMLCKLCDENFKVTIIRPPMIYGRGSKGNYPKLSSLIKKICIFPSVSNIRSMLYIENLCKFIELMIDNEENGIFYPQNEEYVNVYEMVKVIASANGKKVRGVSLFNPVLKILSKRVKLLNKIFGELFYDREMSEYKIPYAVVDFEESIKRTELGENCG